MKNPSYLGKIKTSLHWWLSTNRPFIIDDQFEIKLLYIDRNNNSAKIQVTNLKTGDVSTQETSDGE